MHKITSLLLLISSIAFSQQISGIVYDEESPVSGAKIMNVSSKSITSSDLTGKFELYARLNDTLVFTSLFHETKKIVLSSLHFEETVVFELKKSVNQLDEVALAGSKARATDEELTKTIDTQFKTDIEKNPHLYRRPNRSTGPIDIMEIGRRVAKLFKKEHSKIEETFLTPITSENLNALFKTDKVFNDTFLILNLNITKEYKQLFFAYCETQHLPTTLLEENQKFYLMDELLILSNDFQKMLKESQQTED